MQRVFKTLGIFLIMLLLIIFICVGLLISLVSPDRFKPMIVAQVKKMTGRELMIDGDLSWTVFPSLGVTTGHMALLNPQNFSEKIFAEVKNATVSVKLMPLLHSKVESNGISISGMKLNLIKNASGQTNWDDLQKNIANSNKNNQPNAIAKTTGGALYLAVSQVDLKDATINWIDLQNKKNITINHFNFTARDISLNKSFPIRTRFEFLSNSPQLNGDFTLNGHLNLQNKDIILSNGDFKATIFQDNKKNDIKGDVEVNSNQDWIQLKNLLINAADIKMLGQLNINQLTKQPSAIGHFKIDAADVGKLRIKDIRFSTNFKNNVLQLNPMTAQLYDGNLQGQMNVDLKSSLPKITLKTNLTNVQLEPLLNDLSLKDKKIKVKGLGNIALQANSVGSSLEAILKNLNGMGNFSVANGIIDGIDVAYYVDSAQAFINRQNNQATDTKQTSFGSLTGTFSIKNGIIENNDLLMESPRIKTKGNGDIDLPNQKIDYNLQASIKQLDEKKTKNDLWHIYGLTIPIHIAGNLQDPSIRLDTGAILKQAFQKQIGNTKEKVVEKIKDNIQDQIKDKAGDLLKNFLNH